MSRIYNVWCPDRGYGPDDGRAFNAIGPADAAQQWALCDDYESCEFTIAKGQDIAVTVSDGANEWRYVVSGEAVPQYTARPIVGTS